MIVSRFNSYFVLLFFSVLLSAFFISVQKASAQNNATVYGTVSDTEGKFLEGASVSVFGEPGGVITNPKGYYELKVESGKEIIIVYQFLGKALLKVPLTLNANEERKIDKVLVEDSKVFPIIDIYSKQKTEINFIRIDPKEITNIPNPSGSFEAVVKTFQGVVSNNELSSAYSVRGGNFDENLVYVNNVEIYRPFLVRSGQQEGLSFINPSLVSSIEFSAGGFEAKYGDKLSSALDIKYRVPTKFAGSANGSLLGANAHLEGVADSGRFNYLTGIRYKTNQYLLNTLDTDGDYKPSFVDVQSYLTYKLSKKSDISFLGNYSRNRYSIVPANRETEFGTFEEALKLRVFFDGQEQDDFETGVGAFTYTYKPKDSLTLKIITSAFSTVETESFDILGQYFLDELNRDFGSDEFGEVLFNRGVGTFLDHARNSLDAFVYNAEHKGTLITKKQQLDWGLKYQYEEISDELSEWDLIDSSGFSLPQLPSDQIILQEVIKSNNSITSNRVMGFLQSTFGLGKEKNTSVSAGVRFNYWDFSEQFLVSPRVVMEIKSKNNRNLKYKLAAGVYHQPPFYRELRDYEGKLNPDIKAQRSIHFVAGTEYKFLSWGREFILNTEAYYKILDNVIPYKIDNLRIRYLGANNAEGYAAGIDARINGEFVPGVQSWASLSILKTQEDLKDDFYFDKDSNLVEPGFLDRPTDQRVTFSLFFQDYLPNNPTLKMNMTLVFGTGLPFGPPGPDRYKDVFNFPFYRRVDIGLIKEIKEEDSTREYRFKLLNHLKSMSLSLEVFNLLQVNNVVSYLWITDISSNRYAVPNFLTSRQVNLRLSTTF